MIRVSEPFLGGVHVKFSLDSSPIKFGALVLLPEVSAAMARDAKVPECKCGTHGPPVGALIYVLHPESETMDYILALFMLPKEKK